MDNYFQSDDILLCSFLLTQEAIHLIEVIEDHPHHFIFSLSNLAKCNELKTAYLNNASSPARELFSNREMLIGEIKKQKLNSLSQRA